MNKSVENDTVNNHKRTIPAISLWFLFIILAILINGTIPFILGADLHSWTYSPVKDTLFNILIYGGLFLVLPLIITKGWATVRRPAFLIPLIIALLALSLRTFFRPVAALAVIIIFYLHWRFDLSKLGIRSSGWKSDLIAVLLFGLIYSVPSLFQPHPSLSSIEKAILGSLDRLFLNPASTTEYIFYFGFLAEVLSHKTGKWATPFIIAAMYTAHEMSNPEYWIENTNFVMIFIGIALTTLIYLWRRSIIVIWIGDGLGRFITRLLSGAG